MQSSSGLNQELNDSELSSFLQLVANLAISSGIRLTREYDDYKIKINNQAPLRLNKKNPIIVFSRLNKCFASVVRSRTKIIVFDLGPILGARFSTEPKIISFSLTEKVQFLIDEVKINLLPDKMGCIICHTNAPMPETLSSHLVVCRKCFQELKILGHCPLCRENLDIHLKP